MGGRRCLCWDDPLGGACPFALSATYVGSGSAGYAREAVEICGEFCDVVGSHDLRPRHSHRSADEYGPIIQRYFSGDLVLDGGARTG